MCIPGNENWEITKNSYTSTRADGARAGSEARRARSAPLLRGGADLARASDL